MTDPTSSTAGVGVSHQQPTPSDPASLVPSPQQLQSAAMQNPDLLSGSIPAYHSAAHVGLPHPYRTVSQYSHLPAYPSNIIASASVPPPGIAPPAPGSVPSMQYQVPFPGQPPNPALRPPFTAVPNGYAPPGTQVTVAPPGIARFPSLYNAMVRPIYPLRPPGVMPVVTRPPVPGIPGVRPIMPPVVRPAIPLAPGEKPQTTVYVGKIAPTIEDGFMLSLLQLCGPVRSWKRGRDPSGAPRGFGFCEFESAEGVLRCLRLLNRYNVDGQEFLINVNQATKEFLERYIEKKIESSCGNKEAIAGIEKEESIDGKVDSKSSVEASKNDAEKDEKEVHDLSSFGIVTDEDKVSDRETLAKLVSMLEERVKNRPLPPPPPLHSADRNHGKNEDGSGDDANDDKNEDDLSEHRTASEHERNDTISPDMNQRFNRRSRDRERDLKREQEREIERYEREAERERVRKERELRRKIEDADRAYEERLKDWEYREREKEKQRQYEREREKEKERKRRKEVLYDEEDEDDDRKRWRRSVLEEKKRKRLQEKKEDVADRIKEEEEKIEEARRKAEEKLKADVDESPSSLVNIVNGNDDASSQEEGKTDCKSMVVDEGYRPDSGFGYAAGDTKMTNGLGDEMMLPSVSEMDNRQFGAPPKKLGFGLVGSGKRATVPSVFHEEDDDDTHKEKKMRPLVPIDYSTEELQAIQPTVSGAQAAAADSSRRYPKEERHDAERERSRRSHDRSSRDRDHNDGSRDVHGGNSITPDKQRLLDAKQLIDMIPKTKDELFSYEINWPVYDKHKLHERMKPWISKKITEFLGEEEATLVDYIVSGTREHVQASQMLEMLQAILDDEAEMFVLKMWRMLIFEIKKVETGLALRPKP